METIEFAARKDSGEIAKLVASFAERAQGTLLEGATKPLRVRLRAFREFFEETPTGRQLAKILDKQAPDFTLDNLEGKHVKFRDTVRNKVTLLTFWGVG